MSGEGDSDTTLDDIPLIDLEREIFCECGSWKNFFELEDSISLDELIEIYEATMERQNRLAKTVAMAMGADIDDDPPPTRRGSAEPDYVQPWEASSGKGGEVEPVYGQEQVSRLPINLGYSIME